MKNTSQKTYHRLFQAIKLCKKLKIQGSKVSIIKKTKSEKGLHQTIVKFLHSKLSLNKDSYKFKH